MATIESYDTKAGKRYRVRYRTPDRKQTDKRGFTTKRAAQDFAATVEVEKLTGSYIPPSAGRVAFGECAELWMAGKVNLSESTRSRYRSALDVHVLPTFKATPLSDMSREKLRRWVTAMCETSSAATVQKNVGVVRQVLEQAVEDSRIVANPATGLDLPTIEHNEMRYLTVQQVNSLADAADQHSLLCYTLAYCGPRFGEAAALQVADVDLDRQRLRIHRSVTVVDSKLVFSSTKSNKGRDVPIPGFLCELFEKRLDGKSPEALVFPDSRGGPMRANNVRRRWWNTAVEKSTAPEGLTPHEMRHTCASLAITAGANIKTLQRMLGHSSAALTLDRYGHLFDDDLGMVGDQLDKLARGELRSLRVVG
ncbi:tyrosine-type recombinase/integrase [Rhodococcus sp. T2V]|uniref:tyrosine-type recombinase/integrase n=1 Tax=Rhodococcus sp. T2V TaxID=3034164 RepID=UPI0023E341AD|nr:tyrosine-type recombinase/integrase [Rhodococcus sp. T2V]MDF3309894.1 tyrosine-type recombinase/integrase [Rhodococcus sp. T2V]